MRFVYYLMLCAALAILISGCAGSSDESSGLGGGRPESVNIGVSSSGLIVFSGVGVGGTDLYLLNTATNKVSRLTESAEYETTPAFSPDGKSVVYAAAPGDTYAPSHIYMIPASGGKRVQLTSDSGAADYYPRFSGDGSMIVFSRAHRKRSYSFGGYIWDNMDIYVMDSNGSNLRRITNESYSNIASPVFCNKDKRIIYSILPNLKLIIMSVDITQASSVPQTITSGSQPDCLANSEQLTFIDDKKKQYDYEVWTAALDGTGRKQITQMKSYISDPLFTNNGQQIMFLLTPVDRDYPELWIVDRDGKNAKKIADSKLFADPMNWKP